MTAWNKLLSVENWAGTQSLELLKNIFEDGRSKK